MKDSNYLSNKIIDWIPYYGLEFDQDAEIVQEDFDNINVE